MSFERSLSTVHALQRALAIYAGGMAAVGPRTDRKGKGSRHAINWREGWERKLREDNDGLAQVRNISGKSPYIVKSTWRIKAIRLDRKEDKERTPKK